MWVSESRVERALGLCQEACGAVGSFSKRPWVFATSVPETWIVLGLLAVHLAELAAGRSVERPVYSFHAHCRPLETVIQACPTSISDFSMIRDTT